MTLKIDKLCSTCFENFTLFRRHFVFFVYAITIPGLDRQQINFSINISFDSNPSLKVLLSLI